MTFHVVMLRHAEQDLEAARRWAARHAPQTTDRWLHRFYQALQTLAENPDRCPIARENDRINIGLREFLFGRKPNVFRVIFVVRANQVRILRIRRAQRRRLSRKDIEQANEPDE
jgi:hypothetical protein